MFNRIDKDDLSKAEIGAIKNELNTITGVGLVNTISDGLILYYHLEDVFKRQVHQGNLVKVKADAPVLFKEFSSVVRLSETMKHEPLRLISLSFDDVRKANPKKNAYEVLVPASPPASVYACN